MKIKASSNLRGEVVLASVKRSLVADQQLFVSDDQYWNNDIQQALNLGLIEDVEGTPSDRGPQVQKRYVVRSNHRNTMVFSVFDTKDQKRPRDIPIEPGCEFTLTKNAYCTASVQQALDNGLLEEVGVISSEPQGYTTGVKTDPTTVPKVEKKPGRQPKPLPESILPGRAPLTPKSGKFKEMNGTAKLSSEDSQKTANKVVGKASATKVGARAAGPKKGPKKIGAVGRARTGGSAMPHEDSGYDDDDDDDGIEMETTVG